MEIEFLSKQNLVNNIWEFKFSKPNSLAFDAGDYVELSIPGTGSHWLSMASAPNEDHLLFTIKIRDQLSPFKAALKKLTPGDKLVISPAIGNFNLPRSDEKILFIALGIGITPYRGMLASKPQHPKSISLLYVAKDDEHIYEDFIKESGVTYLKHNARFGIDELGTLVPDYSERIIYLSGPQPACLEIYKNLIQSGFDRHRIKLEYFPGYQKI